jgi:hypothetical protein
LPKWAKTLDVSVVAIDVFAGEYSNAGNLVPWPVEMCELTGLRNLLKLVLDFG